MDVLLHSHAGYKAGVEAYQLLLSSQASSHELCPKMERYTMKKPRLFLALEVLLIALLRGVKCQSSQGGGGGGGGGAANLTVTGTVFCDACSSSSFSNHSYFLPGVKVRIDCMIRVNSTSKEEIKITAEKVTNSYGAYQLDIPAIDGFECTARGETTAAESFCRAAVLDNPSALCNVPAVTTTVGHISFSSQESNACLYNLNSLYYRPGKKGAGQCNGSPSSLPAALNTSLFDCPPWPWPPIPFCTPRPWFPPIPFFTPPPPAFPFPLPPLQPIPFLTPPSPPPPAFPFPLPPWPWTPPAVQPPPSFPFPHLPPIFSTPSPPPPPPPAFPFPFHLPPFRRLPPFPHLPPLPSWYSPPLPPPPPPPSFPWPFPPLPFFPPTPSPSAPSPPLFKYSRKDPGTWSSSKNQP